MSEPFLAEIKMYGFNFPPRGWAQCDGQILPINQYQSLYSLLGTTYGGDGRTSFGLPDLRGRVPVHETNSPSGFTLGTRSGTETNRLTEAQIPSHSHGMQGTGDAQTAITPSGNLLANAGGGRRPVVPYGAGGNVANMAATGASGSGIAVNNMQPYLTINFCIALQGLFPSRN